MKKREFFKRLLGITAAAVVAPKVLLAEEEPTKVVVGDSVWGHKSSHMVFQRFNGDPCCQVIDVPYHELLGTEYKSTCVIVSGDIMLTGSVIYLARNSAVFTVIKVDKVSESPSNSQKILIEPVEKGMPYIKKGDFLAIKTNAYAENSHKTKK